MREGVRMCAARAGVTLLLSAGCGGWRVLTQWEVNMTRGEWIVLALVLVVVGGIVGGVLVNGDPAPASVLPTLAPTIPLPTRLPMTPTPVFVTESL